jgi:solute carrier family 25 carnitine/acylcarnitine transporter 20/29
MQTAAPGTYSGLADCAGSLLKNEGPLAFYKGTLTPLLGVGACVSIQFAAAERTKRYFIGRNKETGAGGADGTWLTGGQFALAGVAAGLANSVVSGPVEHIRIREFCRLLPNLLLLNGSGLQTQSAKNPVYNGPLDAFKKIYSQHGIRGIYKGQVATLYREASSYALYFFTYEMLMQREMREKGVARNEVSLGKTVLFGAAAGYSVSLCYNSVFAFANVRHADLACHLST